MTYADDMVNHVTKFIDQSLSVTKSSIPMKIVFILCLLISLGTVCTEAAESLQVPVVKDNSIVLLDGEWDQNAGQQGRIRIKGINTSSPWLLTHRRSWASESSRPR